MQRTTLSGACKDRVFVLEVSAETWDRFRDARLSLGKETSTGVFLYWIAEGRLNPTVELTESDVIRHLDAMDSIGHVASGEGTRPLHNST